MCRACCYYHYHLLSLPLSNYSLLYTFSTVSKSPLDLHMLRSSRTQLRYYSAHYEICAIYVVRVYLVEENILQYLHACALCRWQTWCRLAMRGRPTDWRASRVRCRPRRRRSPRRRPTRRTPCPATSRRRRRRPARARARARRRTWAKCSVRWRQCQRARAAATSSTLPLHLHTACRCRCSTRVRARVRCIRSRGTCASSMQTRPSAPALPPAPNLMRRPHRLHRCPRRASRRAAWTVFSPEASPPARPSLLYRNSTRASEYAFVTTWFYERMVHKTLFYWVIITNK